MWRIYRKPDVFLSCSFYPNYSTGHYGSYPSPSETLQSVLILLDRRVWSVYRGYHTGQPCDWWFSAQLACEATHLRQPDIHCTSLDPHWQRHLPFPEANGNSNRDEHGCRLYHRNRQLLSCRARWAGRPIRGCLLLEEERTHRVDSVEHKGATRNPKQHQEAHARNH